MASILWALWHAARHHRLSIGRPYDAPVGTVLRCHCGDNRRLT